tara:strand:+ start:2091 stop:2687 length:597 start_codon:yes stop_codon:yes gene_type:complete
MKKKRQAENYRKTSETDIYCKVNIDGKGINNINTPSPFMNHMLEQISKHSLIDLNIECKGDIEIDAHHTVEDLGWSIGEAINKAMLNKAGINRYASLSLPMDETLTSCSLDISGRPWLEWKVILPNEKIGDIDAEIFQEFFRAFAQSAKMTIHIENNYGTNAHHVIESCFKVLAICLKNSLTILHNNMNIIPSTKGVI